MPLDDLEHELLEACLKSVYAGHKWMLSLNDAMGQFEQGHVCSTGNAAAIETYMQLWKGYNKTALELHDRLVEAQAEQDYDGKDDDFDYDP